MPFTEEQFFRVFQEYNQGVFPMQVVLILLTVCAVVFACKRSAPSNRIVTGLLAFLWIWAGVVYHLFFFASVNPAAYFFGGMFIVQGCLLVYRGIFQQRLEFRFDRDPHGILGALFVIYSLFIYPLTSVALGHTFPAAPTFGVPCPVTFFTFGLLMWTTKPELHLLAIPGLWAIIATLAAVNFGMKEDLALAVAAVIGTAVLIVRRVEQEGMSLVSGSQ